MSIPILTTKLYIPPPRPNVVLRSRLIARLNAGLHRKLTLISASAGFGKSTLLASWVADYHQPNLQSPLVAWLSLDDGDSDPVRFLTYLVAALQTIAPTLGAGVLGVLQSPQPPPAESILTVLLNEISTLPDNVILVLDDYHAIDSQPVDTALTFLLEHLPPRMHLVIATREDPSLPLARLRARGDLSELRAADLRFTPAEAAEFLNTAMDLHLSPDDIATLEERTEGWIAGLQLAALSMQGQHDATSFIQAFAGDHRYIMDYLVEEVLKRQPERVRSFLLQTAMLDRLYGPLCDAVTGQEQSQAQLEALERGNFFVVPLDNTRHWYRYHHLFADVLVAQLRAEQPSQLPTLHRRASVWYEHHGSAADAIRHALAAQDFARAADLVELAVPATRRGRQEAMLLGWLRALPDELFHSRPVLSVHYAGTLLQSGHLDGVENHLQDAERWLDTMAERDERPHPPASEMVVVDEAEFHRLPGWIAIYRAAQALAIGDVPNSITYARRALDLVPEDDDFRRGAAAAILGLAAWANGHLDAAHQSYADGMMHLQRAGYIADAIGGAIMLADIQIVQGRLREAMRIYTRGLQLSTEQGAPLLRGTADMYVGMSELHHERDDLDIAIQLLLRSQEQGEHMGFPQNPYRWRVAMAGIQAAQGDLDGALELLHEAERRYVSDFSPNVRPVAALVTRVWVAQGRFGEALDWVREQGLSAQDDLSYLREFEHITLARVLLAHAMREHADHSMREASELLQRLLEAAETGERTGSVIEILVLLSLAHQMSGDIPAALTPLARALTLAEPEGYVRLFVDEGVPMAALLQEARAGGILPSYVEKLLAAFHHDSKRRAAHDQTVTQSPAHPIIQSLIEPLSIRERDVLRLLRTDLSGPEIARELIVSLSTLRTHTSSIFAKLGVNNRRAAIRRAEELDLF